MEKRLLTMLLMLLVCGIALSLAAHVFAVFPFDLKITHELQEKDGPVFSGTMKCVSALGEPLFQIILIGFVTALCMIRRMWIEAIFVIATTSSVFLTSLLKVLVGRPRPPLYILDYVGLFGYIDQFSFPSGHVLFFVVFFGFIAYLACLHLAGRLQVLVIAGCLILIIAIAPSRIYLGAHWASDVVGSYIIGALWLAILIIAYNVVIHRQDAKKRDIKIR
jgi:membrane-associated phospholipid phosphatase